MSVDTGRPGTFWNRHDVVGLDEDRNRPALVDPAPHCSKVLLRSRGRERSRTRKPNADLLATVVPQRCRDLVAVGAEAAPTLERHIGAKTVSFDLRDGL